MKYDEHHRDLMVAQILCCVARPFNSESLLTLSRLTDSKLIPLYLPESIGALAPIGSQFNVVPRLDYDQTRLLFPASCAIDDGGEMQEFCLIDYAIKMADHECDMDPFHLDEMCDIIAECFVNYLLGSEMKIMDLSDAIFRSNPVVLARLGKIIARKSNDSNFVENMTKLFDDVADSYAEIIMKDERHAVFGVRPDDDGGMLEVVTTYAMNDALYSLDKLAHAFNLLVPVLLAAMPGIGDLYKFLERTKLIEVIRSYREIAAEEIGQFESFEELTEAIADRPDAFFFEDKLPDPILYEGIAKRLFAEFFVSYKPLNAPKVVTIPVALSADEFAEMLKSLGGNNSSN